MKFKRSKKPPTTGRQRIQRSNRQQPAAFSYYAQRSDKAVNTGREIGREEARQRANWAQYALQRAGVLILTIVTLIVIISNLTLVDSPRIIPLSSAVSQYFLHSTSDYAQATAAILQTSIWNRNKLTINTSAVSQKLQQQFPELSSVSIALPLLGHRPVVYIAPSQPVLILNSAGNGSFVLDENGTALLATTQLPPNSKLDLPIVTDQTGLHVAVGKQVLTSSDVAFIQQVMLQLKSHKISVGAVNLPPATSELDVYPAGQSYFAKFNMHASTEDARQQAGTFIAVQNKLNSQNITPTQYIDVRVDGRAYYQ